MNLYSNEDSSDIYFIIFSHVLLIKIIMVKVGSCISTGAPKGHPETSPDKRFGCAGKTAVDLGLATHTGAT
jgi:hypothetical protein